MPCSQRILAMALAAILWAPALGSRAHSLIRSPRPVRLLSGAGSHSGFTMAHIGRSDASPLASFDTQTMGWNGTGSLVMVAAAAVASFGAIRLAPSAAAQRFCRRAGRRYPSHHHKAGAVASLMSGRVGKTRLRFFAGGFGSPFEKETNQEISRVNGIRHRRLGNTDIAVSELAIGTQRWGGDDFNSPDEELCHALLDRGILDAGLNLIDTAEQYPIPSAPPAKPQGLTEEIIGRWLRKGSGRREKVVIATKITGGRNITRQSIISDCEGSLRRLGTDRIDVYTLHWPARYTPQSNWGQSLEYDWEQGKKSVPLATSFGDIVEAMGRLLEQGKIRGYGSCNDNAVGLMGMAAAARERGIPGPCCMQNDYSILNRRIEENGLSEASSPALENCGFMAYNVLAGGMLTGKYGLGLGDAAEEAAPAAVDDPDVERGLQNNLEPRGRMDRKGWALTLIRYRTLAARQAAAKYASLAHECGLTPTELALRFAAGRSAVTTSLVGHTSVQQLDECVQAFRRAAESPLDPQLRWEIDRVHLQNRLPLFANAGIALDPAKPNRGQIGERVP